MAVDLAPRGPNESLKDAQERRQAAEVKAWIEWDKKQSAAQAQINALDAQAPLTKPQQDAKEENQAKVTDALAKKAAIEYAWEHELKCPIKRLFAEIEKAARDEKTDQLVAETNQPTHERLQALRTEFVSYAQDKETVGLAAQHLLDAALLPADLRGGNNVMRAASVVLPPNLAADFRARLKEEGSEAYNNAIAELAPLADIIQPIYDGIAKLNEAARDLEKGVVVGRTAEAAKDILHNPASLGKVAVGLLGAWALFSTFDAPSDGKKTWFKRILGGLGLAIGASAFIDKETFSNLSPKDWIEKQTGHRMDEIFSTGAMDQVRHFFDGMPTTDTDAVDDMIRVCDAPIENFADMFRAALSSQSHEVETARLLNNGLSEKEFKYADKGSLYTCAKWFFMQCYQTALGKGECPPAATEEAQCTAGMDWAKKNFKGNKVGTCLVSMEVAKMPGAALATETIRFGEGRVTNVHLAALEEKDPAFGRVLEPTSEPNVYLINGYPVRYNYTDSGDHVFTDVVGSVEFVKVDAALTGDALQSTLLRISTEAEKVARPLYAAAAGVLPNQVKYNNKGDWELDPPTTRAVHAGLPPHIIGPTDNVPLILYMDVADKRVKMALDMNADGVPELRDRPYTTRAEVAEEFEKGKLHERIALDTSRTLLVPFTVESYSDVGVATEIIVNYGGNTKGKVVYKNDTIESYKLGVEANLEKAWSTQANQKVAEFLGKPQVQAALLRATTKYTGYNQSLFAGMMDKFIGIVKSGYDWTTSDSITARFNSEWEKQVVRDMTKFINDPVNGMAARYVNDVFKTFNSNADFQHEEDVFFNTELTDLEGSGIVMKTVTPLKTPDIPLTGNELPEMLADARDELEVALDPLRYEKSSTSGAMTWRLVNGAWNFVTQDTGRSKLFNDRVDVYMAELAAACNPVPPAAALTREQVKTQIETVVRKAQLEASGYWGLNDRDATKKLMLVPLGPNPAPEWKKSTEVVADYLANHFKWESYGVFPNPENLGAVMAVWYERMGDPSVAAKSPQEAEQYAKYFLWEVWVSFGGNKDYSLDKLYDGNEIDSVSDTQFQARIPEFRANTKDYAAWSAAAHLELRPPVPGMEDGLEQYKPAIKKQMEDWFAQQNDLKVWSRIYRWGPMMERWPEVYKTSFDRRLNDILQRSTDVNVLRQDLEDYKKFVSEEQHIIYEPLIMSGIVPERDHTGINMPWSVFVEKEITKDFTKYYNATPRDFNGYVGYIKKNMADVQDVGYNVPNIWGIAFFN